MTKQKSNSIIDRIKTVEDAFNATKRPVIDFSFMPEDMREHFKSYYEALVVIEVLNEGWTPDWSNDDERKWYPWFDMSPSAFGFFDSDYGRSDADAGSGSRLKLKSEELADYVAKQFPEVWKIVQLG